MRWLFIKDLQILRRSKLLVALLIIYPIAILSESKAADASAYLEYLKSAKAAPFFEKEGFTVLK